MDAKQAIQINIQTGELICQSYLKDLSDAEMLQRPAPGCNHVNWQVGHLIASEHMLMEQALPGSMPPLPEGFADRYSKARAGIDDPREFLTKTELMAVYQQQRTATLAALEKMSGAELDQKTGIEYAPDLGSIFSLQGSHWLMHAGQWAVLRRMLGRAPLM